MKTILIIEDNQKYRSLLEGALEEEEYKVLTAENGQIALDIVKKSSIDLIILDIVMPEMDGISFYHHLKDILKKHIPIIVLTNLTDAAGYGSEIKDVLIKANTSMDQVITKVKEHLK